MDRFLSVSIDMGRVKKIIIITLVIFLTLPVLINTLLIVPLYATLEADAAYKGSLITVIIKYVQDFLDLCAFSVSYALIIFSTLLLSSRFTALTVIFYSAVYILQIPLKLLMNIAVYGTLGTSSDIIIDLIYLGIYFGLQMLQLLLVYVFARVDSDKFKCYAASVLSAKKTTGIKKILPFSKFVDWNNPLLRSTMKMSLLVLGIKIASRIVNDISYGAPKSIGEALIMLVYYFSDLIYGVVAYVAAAFTISAFYDKIKKKDAGTPTSDS